MYGDERSPAFFEKKKQTTLRSNEIASKNIVISIRRVVVHGARGIKTTQCKTNNWLFAQRMLLSVARNVRCVVDTDVDL